MSLQANHYTQIKHLQMFTDASTEGWGAHLNERTAGGTWSLPESKLHVNYLELKAVFLTLEFQDLCIHKTALVKTDNTTVVFPAICNRWHRPQIDLFGTWFNKLPCVWVTGTGYPGHSSGCAQSGMVGAGSIYLPTISHIGQSGDVTGLPMR